jgi:alpha-L-fucosidase
MSRFLLLLFVLVSTLISIPIHADDGETKEQHAARMAWWHQEKFGMFIHWGLYSVAAGSWDGKEVPGFGEWIMHNAKIPVAAYATLAPKFNPTKFNADEWTAIAQDAGMKYMVITSKHHEGFAMFHTKVDSYNIYDATPFKRDPIKELSVAAPKHGIRFGLYYSNSLDWHHPGGDTAGPAWDPAQNGDRHTYVKTVVVPHLTELFTNYGPIAELWFDGHLEKEDTDLVKEVLKLQPQVIVNNRLGEGFSGDFETPENYIPAQPRTTDWETCMTTNDTWGYRAGDTSFRSAKELTQDLVDVVSKGGNYLLNVGPDPEGSIPAQAVDLLHQIGVWMKVNNASIYGTTQTPFPRQALWGRVTQKPGILYLHILTWPLSGKITVPMTNQVSNAHFLSAPSDKLVTTNTKKGVQIQLPDAAPDTIDSVVALNYKGELAAIAPTPSVADTTGVIHLVALEADIETARHVGPPDSKLEGNEDHPNIQWSSTEDHVEWKLDVAKPGNYAVSLSYATNPQLAGSQITISVGDSSVTTTTQPTKDDADFQTFKIDAPLKINQAGPVTLSVAVDKNGKGICRLESVTLTPIH